jgi:predicted Fe-Mo cluster-binding NifX family protein
MLKIAVVSEDGKTVSRHFGRAMQYVIVSTGEGKILSREIRKKAVHADSAASECGKSCSGCRGHGEESSYDLHRPMVLNILDCSVLLVGGMGRGAFEALNSRGINPVITDVEDIEQAVRLYLWDNLPNLMERLH